MADVQVATCDGGKFDPSIGYRAEGPECPSEPLMFPESLDTTVEKAEYAQSQGWTRRMFRGPKHDDPTRPWSFCPKHVMVAIEQHYLKRFSDDGE